MKLKNEMLETLKMAENVDRWIVTLFSLLGILGALILERESLAGGYNPPEDEHLRRFRINQEEMDRQARIERAEDSHMRRFRLNQEQMDREAVQEAKQQVAEEADVTAAIAQVEALKAREKVEALQAVMIAYEADFHEAKTPSLKWKARILSRKAKRDFEKANEESHQWSAQAVLAYFKAVHLALHKNTAEGRCIVQ